MRKVLRTSVFRRWYIVNIRVNWSYTIISDIFRLRWEKEAENISEEKSVPVKKEFEYFPVSMLNGKFIIHETRRQELGQFSLVLMGEQELHAQQLGK